MNANSRFKPYLPDQTFLLPPSMREWLPDDDLVFFITDLVSKLDLSAIYGTYDKTRGGQPAYNPTMMTGLLFYAYCRGVYSSRKIERATYHQIPFRVLTGDQQPDHDTIAEFRNRHLGALSGLFVQVLRICQKTGMVKLGHVSLDGTKVKANASKHKAMSYGRMEKKAKELNEEVEKLMKQAQTVDEEEDREYGRGKRGDELPEELRFKKSRLRKIEEAMKELEEEAREKVQEHQEAILKREAEQKKTKRKQGGKNPEPRSDKPKESAQRNFTDPESRIMKDSASGSFEQCYNCQAAVDEKAQIIVGAHVTQEANDKKQLRPVVEKLKENLNGETPEKLSADAGYYSENNVKYLEGEEIDGYISTGKEKHRKRTVEAPRGRIPKNMTIKERMSRKLRTQKGRKIYGKRKQIPEPVFGQIKEVRGFRRFLLRGLEKVGGEWDLICLTHNLLKLFQRRESVVWP